MSRRAGKSLRNKVVAITGGARGIGLATAKACVAQGAKVSIGDVDESLAVQEAAGLGSYGGRLDVRSRDAFAGFLDATREHLGPIDVLINNAGIMPTGPFIEETDAVTDAQIDVNLRGVIHGCKLVLPGMLHRGQGHIVNVASMAGVLPVPGLAVYCATKFAVMGLTQTLREEYRDSGIHFSAILPAKVTTDLASGTGLAAQGVPTSSAEDVAAAIIEAVLHDQHEVMVPRFLRMTPALLSVVPVSLQQGFRRLFGDHRVLDKLDHKAREHYDSRISALARKATS